MKGNIFFGPNPMPEEEPNEGFESLGAGAVIICGEERRRE
jgi:hypothetical protein